MLLHFRSSGFLLIAVLALAACASSRAFRTSEELELSPIDAYEIAHHAQLLILDIRTMQERDRDGAPSGVSPIAFYDPSVETTLFLLF